MQALPTVPSPHHAVGKSLRQTERSNLTESEGLLFCTVCGF